MNRQTVVVIALAVIAVMNVVAFTLMGIDKRRARRGAWRISERALFMTTACFGGLGGVLGMKVFHHKTQHWYFRVFFPLLLVLQTAILAIGVHYYS
jgi:uncharacterized membrane protein YsdA (DUF1294 family)